jgi:hypothetical protein
MGAQAIETLEAAAARLAGPVIRTSASVIGKCGGESVIVATTGWGYIVTVLYGSAHVAFTVRERGWLKKSLALEGQPMALAREVVDAGLLERLAALAPLHVELGPTAIRLEHRYGPAPAVVAAIDLVVELAKRARRFDTQPYAKLAV